MIWTRGSEVHLPGNSDEPEGQSPCTEPCGVALWGWAQRKLSETEQDACLSLESQKIAS